MEISFAELIKLKELAAQNAIRLILGDKRKRCQLPRLPVNNLLPPCIHHWKAYIPGNPPSCKNHCS